MIGKQYQALRWVAIAAAIVTLTGCGRGTSDLEQWVAEVKAKPAPALEPVPVMQRFETFLYNDQGLRDPFSAPVDEHAGASGPRPDKDRPKQPLEAYPLDSLVMVGTLGSGPNIIGLVMSPDRVTHRVTTDTYLGQNEGHVTSVGPTKIEITELVPDGAGGWIERPASIALANQ